MIQPRPAPDVARLLQAASAAQAQGRATESARLFNQVLTRDAANPTALNALGMQALARGEPKAAQPLFERAAAADPGSPRLLLNLASAARGCGRRCRRGAGIATRTDGRISGC